MQQDILITAWRKSSYSSGTGQCVEVADHVPGLVPVRDSKMPAGPRLDFNADAWATFVNAVKAEGLTA